MDDEGDRQLGRAGLGGLEAVAPDGVAIGPGKAELLEGDGVEVAQLVGVDVGEPGAPAAAIDAVEVIGRLDRIQGEQDRAVGERAGVVRGAIAGQAGDPATGDFDPEQRAFERVLRVDHDCAAIGGPGDRLDRAVPGLRQRAGAPAGEIAQHQHLPVGLVADTRHGDIRKRAAVGRNRRQRVGRVIGGGEIDGRRGPVDRRGKDVEVGRGRLDPAGFAKGEEDRSTVARNGDFLAAAEGLGGRVTIELAGQANAHALQFPAAQREAVQAAARAGLDPGVPVADEQFVMDLARAGFGRGKGGRGAGHVGAVALVGPDDHMAAVGAQLEARRIGAEIAQHARGLADHHSVQLVPGPDRLEEIERAVGPEDCVMSTLAPRDDDRRCAGAREVEAVQHIVALVLVEVGGRQGEDRDPPVRRDLRRAHPAQRLEIGRGHRPGLRGDWGDEGGGGGGEEERGSGHGARGSSAVMNRKWWLDLRGAGR